MACFIYFLCLFLMAGSACGDIYLHYPRGSNNKLSETSNTVETENRLFDSENHAAGGYQVGDNCMPNCRNDVKDAGNYDGTKEGAGKGELYFYEGSEVPIQWTSQHGCGTPFDKNKMRVHCTILIQYAVDADIPDEGTGKLRDGTSTKPAGGDGDNVVFQVTKENAGDPTRGRHETFGSYKACVERERNKGLFTSDQEIKTDIGAAGTRQNKDGKRYGLECPEERDYYPYWAPTIWRDAAIMTSDTSRCSFFRSESQNVKARSWCVINPEITKIATRVDGFGAPLTKDGCDAKAFKWEEVPSFDIDPPECLGIPEGRENHLGNIATNRMATYMWKVPANIPDNSKVVIRIRYNISTSDMDEEAEKYNSFDGITSKGIANDPTEDFIGLGFRKSGPLQLQVDTSQFGRVFQDRSHTFKVRNKDQIPEKCQDERIVNVGVRGRRGNIVQVYPSVVYDWLPEDLEIRKGDCLHFQWTGSDANQDGNEGHGKEGTDRSNLVQIKWRSQNEPLPFTEHTLFCDAASLDAGSEEYDECADLVNRFAFLDQQKNAEKSSKNCPIDLNDANFLSDNNDDNCQQLNRATAYFDGGVVPMTSCGEHHVASTRNNAFSHRTQKTTIKVNCGVYLVWWEMLLIILGIMIGLILLSMMWNACYALRHPHSALFAGKNRPWFLRCPCCKTLVAKGQQKRDDLAAAIEAHEQKKYLANNVGITVEDDVDENGEKESPVIVETSSDARRRCRCILAFFGLCVGDDGRDRRAVLVFFLLNVGCGLIGFLRHWGLGFNGFYAMAKTGGYILDFNLSLLLIPVLRSLQKYFFQVRALDSIFNSDPVGFHKLVAMFVAMGATIHVVGHIFHAHAVASSPKYLTPVTYKEKLSGTTWAEILFNPGDLFRGFTGIVLAQLMMGMFLTAHPAIRRYTFKQQLPKTFRDCKSWILLSVTILVLFPWSFICPLVRFGWRVLWKVAHSGPVGGFKVFWNIHKLWVPVYALLLIHGKNCFIWFMWPIILVICDRMISRQKRCQIVSLRSAELCRGPVLKLAFDVPTGFVYQAGQYIQICCDGINTEEWHPFTLTSAPEEDVVSIAVRASNDLDWCSALRRKLIDDPVKSIGHGRSEIKAEPGVRVVYELKNDNEGPKANQNAGGSSNTNMSSRAVRLETFDTKNVGNAFKSQQIVRGATQISDPGTTRKSLEDIIRPPLPIEAVQMRIDGPHGAPTELVWKCELVMLVGAGIGVTPFAAILKSLELQLSLPNPTAACKKVYFYWLCRGQDEFYWFYDLLVGALKGKARERVVVHLYQTGEVELKNVKDLGPMFHQFMGKPNWRRIMQTLSDNHKNDAFGVFLCGPQAIRLELVGASTNNPAIEANGTTFTVHAENF